MRGNSEFVCRRPRPTFEIRIIREKHIKNDLMGEKKVFQLFVEVFKTKRVCDISTGIRFNNVFHFSTGKSFYPSQSADVMYKHECTVFFS